MGTYSGLFGGDILGSERCFLSTLFKAWWVWNIYKLEKVPKRKFRVCVHFLRKFWKRSMTIFAETEEHVFNNCYYCLRRGWGDANPSSIYAVWDREWRSNKLITIQLLDHHGYWFRYWISTPWYVLLFHKRLMPNGWHFFSKPYSFEDVLWLIPLKCFILIFSYWFNERAFLSKSSSKQCN